MVILMKVTSRGRPDVLYQTIQKYLSLANNTSDMRWVYSLDEDDNRLSEYAWTSGNNTHANPPSNKITAINSNIPKSGWDILLNISDDQIPIRQGYDDMIRKAMPDSLDASLWFNDGWQNRINTQEIVGRKYYERFGYVYHPEYKSFFCDNEATLVAQRIGKQIKNNKCIIRHDHPLWNNNSHVPLDDLYKSNNQYWKHDEDLFIKRQANGFT